MPITPAVRFVLLVSVVLLLWGADVRAAKRGLPEVGRKHAAEECPWDIGEVHEVRIKSGSVVVGEQKFKKVGGFLKYDEPLYFHGYLIACGLEGSRPALQDWTTARSNSYFLTIASPLAVGIPLLLVPGEVGKTRRARQELKEGMEAKMVEVAAEEQARRAVIAEWASLNFNTLTCTEFSSMAPENQKRAYNVLRSRGIRAVAANTPGDGLTINSIGLQIGFGRACSDSPEAPAQAAMIMSVIYHDRNVQFGHRNYALEKFNELVEYGVERLHEKAAETLLEKAMKWLLEDEDDGNGRR